MISASFSSGVSAYVFEQDDKLGLREERENLRIFYVDFGGVERRLIS